MRHIFPDVPINAGAFEPLTIKRSARHLPRRATIRGRFRAARPKSSQRIAEAVFAALVQAMPDQVTAAPAGTSGNFALGGHDPEARPRLRDVRRSPAAVMAAMARQRRVCPTAAPPSAFPRSPPVEVMEQDYPVLFRRYRAARGFGRRRRASRRLRRALRGRSCCAARRAPPWSWTTAASARAACWAARMAVSTPCASIRREGRRKSLCAAASVQGPGHPAQGRRPRARRHARRRRLWRSRPNAIPPRVARDTERGYYTRSRSGRGSALRRPKDGARPVKSAAE